MRVLGIETSCDETGVAVYDTARGLLAHALHSQVAMHAAYGGVVPGTRLARPRAAHGPAHPAGGGGRGPRAGRPRRHRVHEGTRARGRAAGRRECGQCARVCVAHPRGGHPPPRGAPAVAAACHAGTVVPVRRAARLRRSQPALRGPGRGPLSPARRHARRCGRRSLRQDGEAARTAVPRRSRTREARGTRPRGRVQAAAPDARFRRPRHELLGIEDRRADAGAAIGSAEAARRADARRHRARVPVGRRGRAGREGPRRARRHWHAFAGRGRRRRRESATSQFVDRIGSSPRGADLLSRYRVLHRQRGDDRVGRCACGWTRGAWPVMRSMCGRAGA